MLKLTFEGDNIAEVTASMSVFLTSLGGGASVAAASGNTAKNTVAAAPKPPTTEELQELFAKSGLKREQKIALLNEFNCAKLGELPADEYAAFLVKLNEAKG